MTFTKISPPLPVPGTRGISNKTSAPLWGEKPNNPELALRPPGRISPTSTSKELPAQDLVCLDKLGFLQSKATGLGSITRINAEIVSLCEKPLRVNVTPGTYFLADGAHQRMVVTAKHSFTLLPLSRQQLELRAACLDITCPSPGWGAPFEGVKRVGADLGLYELERFLEACQGVEPMAIQAGVWALRTGLSAQWIQSVTAEGRPLISDRAIAEARRILDRLGIKHTLHAQETRSSHLVRSVTPASAQTDAS